MGKRTVRRKRKPVPRELSLAAVLELPDCVTKARRYNGGKDGECFSVALKLASELFLHGIEATICHGVVTCNEVSGEVPGQRILHGWVEITRGNVWVLDASRVGSDTTIVPAEFYYTAGKIVPGNVRRYSMDDVIRIAGSVDHCGAWERPREDCYDLAELEEQEVNADGYYVGYLSGGTAL
jgi:hypothetical protein